MKKTGKELSKLIKTAQTPVTDRIEDIDREITVTENIIEQQNKARESAIIQLAEMFLPDGKRIGSEFHSINGRVQALFNERHDRRTTLNLRIDGLQTEKKELTSQIDATADAIAAHAATITQAQSSVDRELADSKEYTRLREELKELTIAIQRDDARLETLQSEIDVKLKIYLADPFFGYLFKRSYGRKSYIIGPLTKLDGWLARITNFSNNLQRYDILIQIPNRVRANNETRRAEMMGKADAERKMVEDAEKKFKISLARESYQQAQLKLKSLKTQLANTQQAISVMAEEKNKLDTTSDPYIKRAKDELKQFFAGQTIASLWEKVKASPTPDDDVLISILEKAEKTINEQRKKAKALIIERKELEDKADKLRTFSRIYTNGDYDNRDSRFNDSFDMDKTIAAYMAGALTDSMLRETLNTHHSIYREPEPSYRSSYSEYSRPSSSSGSSWGSSSSSDSGSSYSSSSSDSCSSGGFDSGSSSCDSGCSSGGFD